MQMKESNRTTKTGHTAPSRRPLEFQEAGPRDNKIPVKRGEWVPPETEDLFRIKPAQPPSDNLT
jgi:hypothetical protein